MSLPELLAGAVDDEDVVARVSLGGDDVLAVTPTRTLVYRAEGLLSDETVEEYSHDVERVDVSTGRRKAKLTLGYGLDGEETISLPTKRLDDALHPVLAGILSGRNVTQAGESVLRTFRFSELTLIVTSHRLVKHIGSAVWDEEFEEFPYADLTGLDFEEGTVATAVVLTHAGRSERFKAPNESARAVKETLADAVCEFHDVDSVEEFRLTVAEAADGDDEEAGGPTDFGDGPDPLSASPAADAETATETGDGAIDGASRQASGDASELAESTTDGMTVAEAATGDAEPADPLAGDPGAEFGGEPTDGNGTETVSAAPDAARPDAGTDQHIAGVETTSEPANDDGTPADPGDAFEGSPFESAGVEDDDVASEIAALRDAVERQSERLDRQTELIERLIEELRRGR
ncbi:DUF7115 domain-containing protein [Halorubrum sp. DTA98]|uniref:DUF7115 domain-containing protein n=1 Tax=Halorubrum sp. DTA98 TaxID=3402163 RepID=UPI003AB00A53